MREELKPCPSCKKKSAILCEFYVKCMNCGRMMMLKEDYNEEMNNFNYYCGEEIFAGDETGLLL